MHTPTITAGYLAVLALLYVVLSLQVIQLRRMNRAALSEALISSAPASTAG